MIPDQTFAYTLSFTVFLPYIALLAIGIIASIVIAKYVLNPHPGVYVAVFLVLWFVLLTIAGVMAAIQLFQFLPQLLAGLSTYSIS